MADFIIRRGDTGVFNMTITRTNPDNGVTSPVNLSGATVSFTAKRRATDPAASAVVRLDNGALGGVVVTDAANGKAQVRVAPAATSSLEVDTVYLVYDVQLFELSPLPDGTYTTVATGQLVVMPDVTRAT